MLSGSFWSGRARAGINCSIGAGYSELLRSPTLSEGWLTVWINLPALLPGGGHTGSKLNISFAVEQRGNVCIVLLSARSHKPLLFAAFLLVLVFQGFVWFLQACLCKCTVGVRGSHGTTLKEQAALIQKIFFCFFYEMECLAFNPVFAYFTLE